VTTPEQFAVRRETLKLIRDKILACEPLEYMEIMRIDNLLETILEGGDVREDYGIARKRGAPETTKGFQQWIALHYWSLCDSEPEILEKVHVSRVAELWGCSPTRVRAVAAQLEPLRSNLSENLTRDTIEKAATVLAVWYRRILPSKPKEPL
jgi:hypothetical protein